jgi:uncharacterized protein (DUF433 family)
MILPEWLTRDGDGHIHLTGHRIGLVDVLHFYLQGDSPEMLHCRFPSVALPVFYKVIAFYLENQEAADAYLAATLAASAQQRAEAQPGPSLEELRRRREVARLPQGA